VTRSTTRSIHPIARAIATFGSRRRRGRTLAAGVAGNSELVLMVILAVMVIAIQAAEAQTGEVSQAGRRLTANEATLEEDSLTEDPDDLTARSALITYYFRIPTASKAPDLEEKREQHILWLIQHHPDAEFAGSPEAHIEQSGKYGSAEGYQHGKQLWLQQVDSHPDNVRVLDNAAKFVSLEDPNLERQLLEKALALEPSDALTLSLLACSYELERIHVQAPEEKAALAEKALSLRERGLGNAKPTERFHALGQVATDAFDAGDTAKAGRYASELLQSAPEFAKDWNYGNAIHTGNIVLGRVALQHGDIPGAEQYLLAAGKTPGSPQLDSFGPNMVLAKGLLEKGHRDVVVAYLQSCAGFWKMGGDRLQLWISTVKAGGIPNFGANLVY